MCSKTFCTYNKPWFTPKLRHLRQTKKDVYRSGDRALYRQVRNMLTNENSVAKRLYSENLRNNVLANNPATVWRGLQITG